MINQLNHSPNPVGRFQSPPRLKSQQAASTEPAEQKEQLQLSEAAKNGPEAAPEESKSFFSGGFAKTAMMVGLGASLAMGMTGCTTMQTSCGPMGCVTQEVVDPVGTAIAIGAGAIILDGVLDNAQHQQHYEHHNQHHNHYHTHDGYNSHLHPHGPNHHYGGHGYGYGY